MAISLEEAVEALQKYGSKRKAAEALGVPRTTFRGYIKRAEKQGLFDGIIPKPTLEEKGDTLELTSPREKHIRELDELITECNVDLDVWEVERHILNKWDVTNKYGSRFQNWQVKAWLKKNKNKAEAKIIREELLKELKELSPIVPTLHKTKKGKHLLLINIFDIHLGKLGWKEESGENYNLKIASKTFLKALQALVSYGSVFDIDRILFIVGNDLFNADIDSPHSMTTRGTPQQTDSRWQKIFRVGRKLMIKGIEYLKTVAPVDVIVIPGNHDFHKTFYLGDVLEVKYENDANVTVNNSAATRKYYDYGISLLGFSHGNSKDDNVKRLLQLMPTQVPQLWAKSLYREWFLGDIHHQKVVQHTTLEDHQGIVIRYMKSISGSDSWHAQKGFVGAIKGAEAYIYHEEEGPIANFQYNLKGPNDHTG